MERNTPMEVGFYGGKRCQIGSAITAPASAPDETAPAMDAAYGTLSRYGSKIISDGQTAKTFTFDTEADAIAVMDHARHWQEMTK